jgi:predicted phosphoribosyltransferase
VGEDGIRFIDRHAAGRALAGRLSRLADRDDVVVLALPRGGVPVGYEIAEALHVPLRPFVVRKLGVPGREELAMGAIASGGTLVVNRDVVEDLDIPSSVVTAVGEREQREVERRERAYQLDPLGDLRGRTVVVVDDGLATGSTMVAAVHALRLLDPGHILIAVPVAAPDICGVVAREADETLCLMTPDPFMAVGAWYESFDQTGDDEVRELIERHRMHLPA